MKAAMFYGAGDIRIEETATPMVEADGDVIIRVKASGICGSDLHGYRQGPPESPGRIMGHEYSGEIAEIGGQVEGLSIGDRVVAVSFGSNAEYIRIPREGRGIIRQLPPEISFVEGATIEPLANSVHIANLAKPYDDHTIVVYGLGVIGLGTVQALRAMSSAKIIAIDTSEMRLSVAKQVGADILINAEKEDPYQKVLELTGSIPIGYREETPAGHVDAVCDCAGWLGQDTGSPPVAEAVKMLRHNGRLVEHSIFEKPPLIDFFLLVHKQIKLLGSWGFSFDEYPQSIEMMRAGKVDRKPLVTHEFPLDEAKEAFDAALEYETAIKVVITP